MKALNQLSQHNKAMLSHLSTPEALVPFFTGDAMVGYTGRVKKRYDSSKVWQRCSTTSGLFLVDHAVEDTCYVCKDWDVATAIQSVLLTKGN